MKALIRILVLLLLSSPVLADQDEAGPGETADAADTATETLPAAPQNIKVNITPQTLVISWENSPEEQDQITGYEINRANNYSGPYKTIATIEKGIYHYDDTAVSPEVVYFYKVRAVSGDRYSSYSSIATGEIAQPGHEKGRRR